MKARGHISGSDLRGYGRLAVDATIGLTRLVETLHHNILRAPGVLGQATQAPAGGVTGLVYRTIRGVTRLVGGSVDALFAQLAPLIGGGESSLERDAVLAALNGVLGDHLASNGNPLAIPLSLRRNGSALESSRSALAAVIPAATGKLLLLAHGLCMDDRQWLRRGHDHGGALAVDAGYTPVYLHYNSGRHVSTNGREFAQQIENLLRAWPVSVDEIVIIGYSMGGLVTRSACHYAQVQQHAWLRKLRTIIFLGTPHHGALLERGGNWIDTVLDSSPYTTAFARLGKIRSAGVTDLRHASMLDEDWEGRDRFARSARKPTVVPLPRDVQCFAIAASIAKKTRPLSERLVGDGLVPLASAFGSDADPGRDLGIPQSHRWTGYGMNHLDLLDRREVYAQMRKWLNSPAG